jgi:hypothetical protein
VISVITAPRLSIMALVGTAVPWITRPGPIEWTMCRHPRRIILERHYIHLPNLTRPGPQVPEGTAGFNTEDEYRHPEPSRVQICGKTAETSTMGKARLKKTTCSC